MIPGLEDGIPDVSLDEQTLFEKATELTGLSDWGDRSFHTPLRILLKALNEEAGLHQLGRYLMFGTLVRLLSNRLKIQHDLASHPDILEVPIVKPLYVLGFPRTGTTFLHNLLACDPNARSISLWEGLYPSPPPDRNTRDCDPRIEKVTQWIATINAVSPQLASAHHLNPTGPEECLWLFEHTFVDLVFDLRAHMPSYSKYLIKNEGHVDAYAYYKTLLQLLAWRCDGQHWVLKVCKFFESCFPGTMPTTRGIKTIQGRQSHVPPGPRNRCCEHRENRPGPARAHETTRV